MNKNTSRTYVVFAMAAMLAIFTSSAFAQATPQDSTTTVAVNTTTTQTASTSGTTTVQMFLFIPMEGMAAELLRIEGNEQDPQFVNMLDLARLAFTPPENGGRAITAAERAQVLYWLPLMADGLAKAAPNQVTKNGKIGLAHDSEVIASAVT